MSNGDRMRFKMKEVDLTEQAVDCGLNYLESGKVDPNADLEKRTLITNCVASGFYMGIRWYEEQLGLQKEGGECGAI